MTHLDDTETFLTLDDVFSVVKESSIKIIYRNQASIGLSRNQNHKSLIILKTSKTTCWWTTMNTKQLKNFGWCLKPRRWLQDFGWCSQSSSTGTKKLQSMIHIDGTETLVILDDVFSVVKESLIKMICRKGINWTW